MKKKNEESKISEGQKECKEKWKEKVSEKLKMIESLVEEGMETVGQDTLRSFIENRVVLGLYEKEPNILTRKPSWISRSVTWIAH
ncbi:hypothetical protein C2G38_2153447 [Gigaspora rosea]|uniref:Uncharacterized protein n=1 Tax=Gigaspora rosea TaxID=44941 RepID=A0A397W9K1_9GLOM|nr:hypothetical protein C2G38_2153447 [Gigaspora rosea]